MKEVLKRKCSSFFTKEDRETVKDAVSQVHTVMTNASVLMRAYYIQQYEEMFEDKPLEVSDYDKVMPIDEDLLKICCDVVTGDVKLVTRERKSSKDDTKKDEKQLEKEKKKTEAKKEKLDAFGKVYSCFQSLEMTPVTTSLSLSHILGYSIQSLITAYTTNVWMHYRKYVLRYVRCVVLRALNVEATNKEITFKIRKLTNHVLEGDPLPEEWDIENIDIDELKELLVPQERKNGVNSVYDAKSRHWYLAYNREVRFAE